MSVSYSIIRVHNSMYNIVLCIIFIHILQATNPQFPRCCWILLHPSMCSWLSVPSDSKVLQRIGRFDSPRLAYLVSAYSATFVYCWPRWSTACLSLQEASTVSDPEIDTASYLFNMFPSSTYMLPAKLGPLHPQESVYLWFCEMMRNAICSFQRMILRISVH